MTRDMCECGHSRTLHRGYTGECLYAEIVQDFLGEVEVDPEQSISACCECSEFNDGGEVGG